MLRIVDTRAGRQAAQAMLVQRIRASWKQSEMRVVAWRPSQQRMRVFHNGRLWFATKIFRNKRGEQRHWNSFGIYRAGGTLSITVELNIPIDRDDRTVSGFVGKQPSGSLFILHDGAVGGGRSGVNRIGLLSHSGLRLVPVEGEKRYRHGVPVVSSSTKAGVQSLEAFIEAVAEFKGAVAAGEPIPTRETSKDLERYKKEFSGRKRGGGTTFEYFSRHGDVVDALKKWWRLAGGRGTTSNTQLIDLRVRENGHLRVLFEVKSSANRTALYTALGQLAVHTNDWPRARRVVVLPSKQPIPADVERHLLSHRIEIVRFRLTPRCAEILPGKFKPQMP